MEPPQFSAQKILRPLSYFIDTVNRPTTLAYYLAHPLSPNNNLSSSLYLLKFQHGKALYGYTIRYYNKRHAI